MYFQKTNFAIAMAFSMWILKHMPNKKNVTVFIVYSIMIKIITPKVGPFFFFCAHSLFRATHLPLNCNIFDIFLQKKISIPHYIIKYTYTIGHYNP